MGRRIGNWINPNTGEKDWMEPENVKEISLQERKVLEVGNIESSDITFRLSNNDEARQVSLQAIYISNNKTYESKIVSVNELEFAEQFVQKLYAEKSADEAEIIIRMKDECVEDLTKRLMDNNIIFGGMQLSGFGFVKVDGDKVLSIEKLNFNYEIKNNTGIKTLLLSGCVGQVDLKNLNNPEIEFFNGSYNIAAGIVSNVKSTDGKIKDYTLQVENFKISPNTTIPDHEVIENIDLNNDEQVEAFIKSRKKLLTNIFEAEEEDDRLDDILDL